MQRDGMAISQCTGARNVPACQSMWLYHFCLCVCVWIFLGPLLLHPVGLCLGSVAQSWFCVPVVHTYLKFFGHWFITYLKKKKKKKKNYIFVFLFDIMFSFLKHFIFLQFDFSTYLRNHQISHLGAVFVCNNVLYHVCNVNKHFESYTGCCFEW